ncbi:MAG: hypothetical protein A3F09_06150 [Chlamydiae bacterium RIFCSPHIGHO2_12_FULL_49_11]|nr:MAG: hypothetical protein A3F09_06150 [Chlamydiae bacterium RIFCSPHIGHO2_12_FULL_49_11]
MGRLILVRHADSVWNQKNIFTGWVDIGLSAKGIADAAKLGEIIKDEPIDRIYVSDLIRSQMTAMIAFAKETKRIPVLMCDEGRPHRDRHEIYDEETKKEVIPVYVAWELNERYYGKLQGKNKDVLRREVGEKTFTEWRRSYKTSPPGGESLEMTVERVLPFFKRRIEEELKEGKRILIVAHGNSLRGILKYIQNISDEDIVRLEVPTAQPMIFDYHAGAWNSA